jgi:hypothetical protein
VQKYFYWNVIFILFFSSNVLAKTNFNKEVSQNKNFYNTLEKASDKSRVKYGSSIFNQKINIEKKDNRTYKKYLMYFYSESMSFSTIKKLIPQFQNIKNIDNEIEIYIVFNGFPTKGFFLKLRKEYKEEYSKLFKIKIHPPIYDYFELSTVPAYALIKCPEDFRFKQCKKANSVLVRGDISLLDFYQVLSDFDKKYLDMYHKLINIGI